MDEALFRITILAGGVLYQETIIGREKSNAFVNEVKSHYPNIAIKIVVQAYEYVGIKETII